MQLEAQAERLKPMQRQVATAIKQAAEAAEEKETALKDNKMIKASLEELQGDLAKAEEQNRVLSRTGGRLGKSAAAPTRGTR